MKRFYAHFFLLLIVMLSGLGAEANRVLVKGRVTFTNGNPAVNKRVVITTDSLTSATSCQLTHQKFTDINGYYLDTLECSTAIAKVRVYTENCNGSLLLQDPLVPASLVVESNFMVCVPAPTNCTAAFTHERLPGTLSVRFNSNTSQGTTASDSITRRKWTFGNNDTLANVVSPLYTYSQRGTYNVCLSIWTAAGCQKTYCQQITLNDSVPPPTCTPNFTAERLTNTLQVKFNSSSSHGTTPSDSIRRRRWNFGNGDTLASVINPTYTYTRPGTYNVCLTIWTVAGCEKTYCSIVSLADSIPSDTCTSAFSFERAPASLVVKFNSSASSGGNTSDSIISRKWNFGNGDSLLGNVVNPSYAYAQRGVYNVCLTIKTRFGCSRTTCKTVSIQDSLPPLVCRARFTDSTLPASATGSFTVKFNSSISDIISADTIRERTWTFGDGTSLTGNVIAPTHGYVRDGIYTVCLTIKTTKGCQSQECRHVRVIGNATLCSPVFTFEKLAPKKVRFNSSMSYTPAPDSIVQRRWNFGDGTAVLTGNVVSPIKEFAIAGLYNVCLQVKTAGGCESSFCSTVNVQDTSINPNNTEHVSIVSISPNPASTQTATVVWSLHNNLNAELAVYDIYGVRKWAITKVLSQGNNITTVPLSALLPGPYFFRVTTMYGTKSRQFYKL